MKKKPQDFIKLEQEFFDNMHEKKLSVPLCSYVWDVLISTQRGYGFNKSHTLAYSLIALQEMNLAYKFPRIFWDCANLIVNSGGEDDGSTDYGKIATAVNKMIKDGISIQPVDINRSELTFEPDLDNNRILFGMKGLNRVSNDVIEKIIKGRPYCSFKDFLNRCQLNKTVMISLIKSGAFDSLEAETADFLGVESRILIMTYYLSRVSEPKKKLTLQNLNGLIQKDLLPEELEFQVKVFNFNGYLKKFRKIQNYYDLDDTCIRFYEKSFDMDLLEVWNGHTVISQKTWDNIYQKEMDKVRTWLSAHQEETLNLYNYMLFQESWDKYAKGSISAWEMESMCYYYHEHELSHIDRDYYGISDFFELNPEGDVEYYFKRGGKQIPIYKTYRIVGTVLNRNDTRHTVDLLTTTGVVTAKFTRDHYAMYARQLSEVNDDGTKSITEKGWFTRGTKLMLTGIRQENQFRVKTYAHTATKSIYKILDIQDDKLVLVHDRNTDKGEIA